MEELLMTSYLCSWLTILGAVLGSFFDCAVSRWAVGRPPFQGRSHCDACGHALGVRDLIPILGFALHRGKCRYCGEKIPVDCLAAELAGAAGFCLLGACYGPTLETAQWIIWAALLLVMGLIDQAKRIIPNWVLLALAGNRAAWLLVLRPPLAKTLWQIGLALFVPLVLLLLVLLWEKLRGREMMGGGDIKLLLGGAAADAAGGVPAGAGSGGAFQKPGGDGEQGHGLWALFGGGGGVLGVLWGAGDCMVFGALLREAGTGSICAAK